MEINDTKQLVIAECKRVIEILESGKVLSPYRADGVQSELKAKMKKLRRDMVRQAPRFCRGMEGLK